MAERIAKTCDAMAVWMFELPNYDFDYNTIRWEYVDIRPGVTDFARVRNHSADLSDIPQLSDEDLETLSHNRPGTERYQSAQDRYDKIVRQVRDASLESFRRSHGWIQGVDSHERGKG